MSARVLILGCGYAGSAVARRAREQGKEVLLTVRSEQRARALEHQGFDVLMQPWLDEGIAQHLTHDTHVVVAFPPDGVTDARIAPALARACAITYVSSTGVYGDTRGHIDDSTPLPSIASERALRILAAEQCYRSQGGTVLRCPGIYGPDRGLHMRILRGEHRIPGEGTNTLSRIHVEDLASFILAAQAVRGETFVVGDLEPALHIDVVRFVCERHGLSLPPRVPLESVHETLRADRAIDSSRAISALGVRLKYPSYREGMAQT